MQWNHMKSFKFTAFYDLKTKVKALLISDHPVTFFLEIGQFLSVQHTFEKKQLFLGHSVAGKKSARFSNSVKNVSLRVVLVSLSF